MHHMKRISITFSDEQILTLQYSAKYYGITIAEVVRRSVDEHRSISTASWKMMYKAWENENQETAVEKNTFFKE